MMHSFFRGFGLGLASLSLLISIAGCDDSGSKKAPQPRNFDTIGDGSAKRVGGGADEEDDGAVLFRIVRVYRNQKPLHVPPFHENGGTWTYLDCRIGEGSAAINFGVAEQHTAGVIWGGAVLTVPDKETGARLVEAIGHGLGAKPRPAFAGNPPLFVSMTSAVLASDNSTPDAAADAAPPPASRPARFDGSPDSSWSAVKLFFPITQSELFLNFNIALRSGAFSPKDEDYADDVVFELATALRDGPVGRRPADDPTLAAKPVRFGPWQKLGGSDVDSPEFSADGKRITYRIGRKTPAGSKVMDMDIDKPSTPRELFDFDARFFDYVRIGDGTECVVDETVPSIENGYSTEDPHRVWIVNTKTHEKRKLPFWDSVRSGWVAKPLSPDQRYYAFCVSERKGKNIESRLEIYDLKTQQHRVVLNGAFITSEEWTGDGDGLRFRAVAVGAGDPKTRTRDTWSINPADGTSTQIPTAPEKNLREDFDENEHRQSFAPDSPLRLERGPQGQLVVVDVKAKTKREFALTEGERSMGDHLGLRWLSPRFIGFTADELALLDCETMKLSYPMDDKKITPQQYSNDFKWVIGQDHDRAVFFAPILLDAP